LLSSWQIAQLHGQQGQMFGAQQAAAHQLSASMPAPYQGFGIGAQGFGGGGGFGPSPGAGYNYGGGAAYGYGGGNSAGNAGVSMMGGVGNAFFGSMGVMGGMGGAAMGGWKGAMMGAAGGGLIGMAGKHVTGSFMEGAHEQSALERTLSQFQFQNASSRTGKGFSRSDSMQIGNMVRQMERVPEMLTSFGELNKLMDKMGQMGLMQGVRDAGQFMDKFKSTINTLKDLSKMIGTTMEGALQAFGEARQSGFYSQGDIVKNVMNRQITGAMTGMNQSQVGAIQQFGSQVGHASGGSRRTGAQHALRTAGQLGMANQMGVLTNDQIMEMTGKEGAEGIQDLSAQMTQLGYRMGRSNVGQAMTLALGKQEDGRYTGEMDQDLVERVRRGEVGLGELKSLARSKARTRGAKLSFAAHKNRLRSEMVGAVGSEGIAMQLNEILGSRGWSNPDAQNLVMQRFGASEEQANMLQKLMPNLDEIGVNMQAQGANMGRTQARQSLMRERFSSDAIKHKIFKKLEHKISDPFKDAGTQVRNYISDAYEGYMDELTGEYTRTLTKGTSDLVRNSMMGSGSARSRLAALVQGAQSNSAFSRGSHLGNQYGGATRLAGVSRSVVHDMAGNTLSGDQLRRSLIAMGGRDAVEDQGWRGERSSDIQNSGRIVLSEGYSGATSSTSQASIDMAKRVGLVGFSDSKGRDSWRSQFGGSDAYQSGLAALQGGFARGQFKGGTQDQMDQMAKVLRGAVGDKAFKQMQMGTGSNAYVLSQFMGSDSMKGYYGAQGLEEKWKGLLEGYDLKDARGVAKGNEETRKSLAKSFKQGDGMASFAELDKMLQEDSTMRSLILGSGNQRGLADSGSGSAFQNFGDGKRSGTVLRHAIEKDPDSWSKEEEAAAAKVGITKEYARKNKDKLSEVKKAIDAQGGDVLKGMKKLAAGMAVGDTLEIERQFKETGGRMKDSMGRFKTTVEGMSDKGRAAAKSLGQFAEDMSSGKSFGQLGSEEGIAAFSKQSSDLVGQIASLPANEKKKFMSMLAEGGGDFSAIQAMVGTHDSIMRKGKHLGGKKGKDLRKFIGEDAFGQDDQAQEMWKSLETKFGKTIEKGELSELAKTISTGKGGELMARAGSERTSSYISEQEIANSLKLMSDNTKQAAEILKTLVPNAAAGAPAK
jgi:hypothetical protein